MRIAFCLPAIAAVLAITCSQALAWQEPARGSELRNELLSSIRSVVALELNPPIQFVVNDLRHEGDLAYGALQPQRPGGAAITWDSTEMAARGEPEDWYDGTIIHVLFQRIEERWSVHEYSIGATDVWWSQPALCETFAPVIPEYCS